MIKGNELIKQIRFIESEKLKEQREINKESAKIHKFSQEYEKFRRQVEVVESRTKLMEETLSRVKETNYHKDLEIKELDVRLVGFRKEYMELKDKMNRGEKLYDEVRSKFLEDSKKMNKALFQSKMFYTPEAMQERTDRLKKNLRGMTFLTGSSGQLNEGELMSLVEDNKRMEALAQELQSQVKNFDRMELDSEEEIRSENDVEENRKMFQKLVNERIALAKEIEVESEKMKEFEREYELLKNDVNNGMTQMAEFFCTECKKPLNTLS